MSYETQTQVQLNVENVSTKAYDFLDCYSFSFVYVKDFIRPLDDWIISQYLYDSFNKNAKPEPGVLIQEIPLVGSARKKSSRKRASDHLHELALDLEYIRVSAPF